MRITQLKIQNFRGIKKASISTNGSRAAFITGYNAQGKSSILDAIRMALFGAVLDVQGKPYKLGALIPKAGAPSIIMLSIEHSQELFDLTWAREGSTTTFSIDGGVVSGGNAEEQRRHLFKLCGVDMERARIAANAKAMLFSRDIVEPLQSLCGDRVEPSVVTGYAEEKGFSQVLCEWAQDGDISTLQGLRNLGELFAGERLELARSIKNLKELTRGELPELPKLPNGGRAFTVEDYEKVNEGVAKLRDRVALAKSSAACTLKDGERKRLEKEAETLPGDIDVLTKVHADLQEQANAARDKAREMQAAKSKAMTLSHAGPLPIELEQTVSRLECVKRGECECMGVPFGTGKKAKAALAEIQAQLEARVEELKADPEVAKAANGKEAERLKVEQAEAEQEEKELRAKASKLFTEIREKSNALGVARTKLDKAGPEPEAADLGELKERLARAEKAAEIISLHRERAAQLRSIEELSHMHKQYDAGAKAFNLGEFFATLDQSPPSIFAGANAALAKNGIKLGVEFSGRDAVLTIETDAHEPIPAIQASKAEQFFAALALGIEFGKGCPVLIDDADALDGKNKAAIARALKLAADGKLDVGSLFVAGAWQKPALPGKEDAANLSKAFGSVALYFAKAGGIEVIE